jgi:hypothetical protein
MPWKFAIGLSLILFASLLGLAPFLVPTRDKVAAKFNDQTFKAAAAIKLFANERF